jgi:DNA polymerase III delta subunit
MPAETSLIFLRSLIDGRGIPPVTVLAGPQGFLREYLLSALHKKLCTADLEYRSFQVGAGDDYAAVLEELVTPGLFARAALVACRVLKSRRERDAVEETEAGGDESTRRGGGDENALAEAITRMRGPSYLVLVYERDAAPAKIKRAAEAAGTSVTCMRPFENQVAQYAALFARMANLRLSSAGAEFLATRYGGDLAAIANALDKAAAGIEQGGAIDVAQLEDSSAARMPELFELADSLGRGDARRAVTILDRAIALGRDPFELLAVEVIPALRRMMIAAALLAHRRSDFEIARAFGLSPQSPLAMRAIDGARRFGAGALRASYRRAAQLDSGFKDGTVREQHQALAGVMLELAAERR